MSSGDIYYRLSFAERVSDLLPNLEARAVAAGKQIEFRRAFQIIQSWLRSDPTSLGEPIRDYPSLRLTEYTGSYGPLAITYAVHWDLQLVFVTKPLEILRWAKF